MRNFKITTHHDVYKDHFENGETDRINGYSLNNCLSAATPIEAIKLYFEKVLYYTFKEEWLNIDEENSSKAFYTVMVDEENTQASELKLSEFKNGNIELFANNIVLTIEELIPVIIY